MTTGLPAADIEAFLRQMHPDWPEAGIAGSLANFEVRPDGTVAPWLTLDRHLQILRSMWEHRPSTRYAELRVPVLLVPADGPGPGRREDKAAGVEAALAVIPDARVQWITGDHDIHAQHPAQVADLFARQVVEGFFR